MKISQYSQENMCWCLLLIKWQDFNPATLFKKDSNTVFSWKFCEIFKNTYFEDLWTAAFQLNPQVSFLRMTHLSINLNLSTLAIVLVLPWSNSWCRNSELFEKNPLYSCCIKFTVIINHIFYLFLVTANANQRRIWLEIPVTFTLDHC